MATTRRLPIRCQALSPIPWNMPEASKIAIYSVAGYAWNPEKYNSEQTWKDAIRTILPSAADELEFFAAHNSDLGPNGHKYRRDESVELQPLSQRFLDSYLKNGSIPKLTSTLWKQLSERW